MVLHFAATVLHVAATVEQSAETVLHPLAIVEQEAATVEQLAATDEQLAAMVEHLGSIVEQVAAIVEHVAAMVPACRSDCRSSSRSPAKRPAGLSGRAARSSSLSDAMKIGSRHARATTAAGNGRGGRWSFSPDPFMCVPPSDSLQPRNVEARSEIAAGPASETTSDSVQTAGSPGRVTSARRQWRAASIGMIA